MNTKILYFLGKRPFAYHCCNVIRSLLLWGFSQKPFEWVLKQADFVLFCFLKKIAEGKIKCF